MVLAKDVDHHIHIKLNIRETPGAAAHPGGTPCLARRFASRPSQIHQCAPRALDLRHHAGERVPSSVRQAERGASTIARIQPERSVRAIL